MASHAHALAERGHHVTSTWLSETFAPNLASPNGLWGLSLETLREMAHRDLAEIEEADVCLQFTDDPALGFPRGGRHWEGCHAYRSGKQLIIIGPVEHIFHTLPGILQYDSWDSFVDTL